MTNNPPGKYTALNIGSGPRNGNFTFLYVDSNAWPIDVRAKLPGLPFENERFEYIQCSHVIEHIDLDDVPAALSDLRRVMMPKGIMYISAPDMRRAEDVKSKRWIHYTEKGGVPEGWEHQWACDISLLRYLLVDAGFVPTWTKQVPQGWQANTHQWPVDFETRFLCRRDDWPWPQAFPQPLDTEVII